MPPPFERTLELQRPTWIDTTSISVLSDADVLARFALYEDLRAAYDFIGSQSDSPASSVALHAYDPDTRLFWIAVKNFVFGQEAPELALLIEIPDVPADRVKETFGYMASVLLRSGRKATLRVFEDGAPTDMVLGPIHN